jgi:hypothetical protein
MERTVFPCEEFGEINVPIDRLYVDGRIDVYPELSRFFDIDYRAGRLVLVAKSYVGLIPVNDRIAIHVVPRFPIANLFYILQRAESKLQFVAGHTRAYDLTGNTDLDPAAIFGSRLLDMLSHVRREGLLRRYVSKVYDDRIDGELLFSDTISRFYSRGVRHRQVRRVTEFCSDVVENRLIKNAIEKLARFYSNASDKTGKRQGRAAAEALALLFDDVSRFDGHTRSIRDSLPHYIMQLPTHHKPYATLLWIAYLIEGRQGLAIEKMGPATFDTFVVNLVDVFEDYVRQVIADNIKDMLPGYFVKNGNVDQVPLFTQGRPMKVKPDIYLVSGEKPTVVLDAKYKPSTKSADRYEVLAFCEALDAKVAIMLSPSIGGPEMEILGRTRGGVEVHVARIDLGAADMKMAEAKFISNLKDVVGSLTAS